MIQPITDMDDLVKDDLYLRLHLSATNNAAAVWYFIPKGAPHKHQCTSLADSIWCLDGKISFCGGKFSTSSCVIKDANIIPNSYNNDSLWHYSEHALGFLQHVQMDAESCRDQYLEVLTRLERGHTYANR